MHYHDQHQEYCAHTWIINNGLHHNISQLYILHDVSQPLAEMYSVTDVGLSGFSLPQRELTGGLSGFKVVPVSLRTKLSSTAQSGSLWYDPAYTTTIEDR